MIRKAHFVQLRKGGTNIGTLFEGAATAVDDNIPIFGFFLQQFFQFCQIFGFTGGPYTYRRFDGSRRSNTDDQWLLRPIIGNGCGQYGRFEQLLWRPGFSIFPAGLKNSRY